MTTHPKPTAATTPKQTSGAKHTPGPWRVELADVDHQPAIWTTESDPCGPIRVARVVCDSGDVDREAYESAVADARLIAQAPAMADFLHVVASAADAHASHELRAQARAILAAIEGDR